MRAVSLDRLRTLVSIADLGSFARAARALHLSPAAVTSHVAELEERVGAALLVRGRPRVAPTAVGETLVERARRILAEADDALEAVRRQVQGHSGRVRIGASTNVLAHLLPPVLQQAAARHPGVEVLVRVSTSQETMSQLALGGLDIGIVALPQMPAAGITVRTWRRDPVVACVPAAWTPPSQVTPQWLAQRPLIANDSSTSLHGLTADWFAAAHLRPRPRIELNYNDAIRSLVAAGYGAALLPQETAPPPDPRIEIRPLRPRLWRVLGVAFRSAGNDGAIERLLALLQAARA